MKKTIFSILFALISIGLLGQQTNPGQLPTKEEYLQKSKNQRTAAWILLSAGVVMVVIIAPGNVSFGTAGALAVGATGCILGSIPLFIAAGRNKKKAMKVAFLLEIQKPPMLANSTEPFHYSPALGVRFNL